MTIQNIGLFGKFKDASVSDAIERVKSHLEANGRNVLLGNTTASEIEGKRLDDHKLTPDEVIDLAIVVGGDGTMLNVARNLSRHDVPAIGVNMGRLGFLTDIAIADIEPSLEAILSGDYHIENRTMLQCAVNREGDELYSGIALNDIVISKGNTGRLIEFEIRVNGQYVSQPRSDGLILSTPTGSTAYALSAGGPIIFPNLPVIGMSPICPHTLSNRPIVLDENAVIEISSLHSRESRPTLALDGVMGLKFEGGEAVTIRKAPKKLKLVRINGFNYFETLYSKLGWQG